MKAKEGWGRECSGMLHNVCQMSCSREVPAEQESEEWVPVGLTLPVLVALLLTPRCSSCGTQSTGPLSVSVPDNPSPGVTGSAGKRSTPSLPELGQKCIEEMRLLSFPVCAGSEIAVLLYTLSGRELWLISKHTPWSGRNEFSHDSFFVLILSFLLEESEHYMSSQMFHHLHNKRRGEGYRTFLPVGLFVWFWCRSRALFKILSLHKVFSPLEETGLRVVSLARQTFPYYV